MLVQSSRSFFHVFFKNKQHRNENILLTILKNKKGQEFSPSSETKHFVTCVLLCDDLLGVVDGIDGALLEDMQPVGTEALEPQQAADKQLTFSLGETRRNKEK